MYFLSILMLRPMADTRNGVPKKQCAGLDIWGTFRQTPDLLAAFSHPPEAREPQKMWGANWPGGFNRPLMIRVFVRGIFLGTCTVPPTAPYTWGGPMAGGLDLPLEPEGRRRKNRGVFGGRGSQASIGGTRVPSSPKGATKTAGARAVVG